MKLNGLQLDDQVFGDAMSLSELGLQQFRLTGSTACNLIIKYSGMPCLCPNYDSDESLGREIVTEGRKVCLDLATVQSNHLGLGDLGLCSRRPRGGGGLRRPRRTSGTSTCHGGPRRPRRGRRHRTWSRACCVCACSTVHLSSEMESRHRDWDYGANAGAGGPDPPLLRAVRARAAGLGVPNASEASLSPLSHVRWIADPALQNFWGAEIQNRNCT